MGGIVGGTLLAVLAVLGAVAVYYFRCGGRQAAMARLTSMQGAGGKVPGGEGSGVVAGAAASAAAGAGVSEVGVELVEVHGAAGAVQVQSNPLAAVAAAQGEPGKPATLWVA